MYLNLFMYLIKLNTQILQMPRVTDRLKSKTCCQGGLQGYHEIGRAVATVMSDEVFHDVAYKAQKRDHLLAGLDEFLDAVTVLPPGEWDPTIRIEPPSVVRQEELIWSGTGG